VASCWWKPELLESDGRARMQKGESKGSEGREEGRLRERARQTAGDSRGRKKFVIRNSPMAMTGSRRPAHASSLRSLSSMSRLSVRKKNSRKLSCDSDERAYSKVRRMRTGRLYWLPARSIVSR